MSPDAPDDYPRRQWAQPARDDYVALLLDRLRTLAAKTHPDGGPTSAKGKDFAAFEALQTAGDLVKALAGWALDHQAGLSMKGLQFVPRQPSGTRVHPEYRQLRSVVDDHAHEKNGALWNGNLDPLVARRLLVNLLYANPGGAQFALQQMAMGALEALDYGEVQPMLARVADSRKHGLTVRRLELRAVGFVEYRRTRFGNKTRARQDVANALGVDFETVINQSISSCTYSPDRNPDELVWKHLRADTVGRMTITDKADFKAKVRASMCQLQNDPEKIRTKNYRSNMPPDSAFTYGLIIGHGNADCEPNLATSRCCERFPLLRTRPKTRMMLSCGAATAMPTQRPDFGRLDMGSSLSGN